MRIQFCSDLHLEFIKNIYFLHANKLKPKADVLILAGDIIPLMKNLDYEKYFDFLSASFKEVYWLPGNHEFYMSDIQYPIKEKKVRENIKLMNNETICIDDVNLIFSTLWSYISPAKELFIKSHLSDFSLIKADGDAFRPKHYNQLHKESVSYIEESLKTLNGKKKCSNHTPYPYLIKLP